MAKKSAKRSAKKSGTKRKLSSYNRFVKGFFAKHKGEDVKKVIKMAAGEWRKLSPEQKKKY